MVNADTSQDLLLEEDMGIFKHINRPTNKYSEIIITKNGKYYGEI